jgi:hypothetical protein
MFTSVNLPAAPRSGRARDVRRTPLALLAVLATLLAAVFGLGAPAQAAGLGTSYFWTYTTPGTFSFNGLLPGVQAYANGTDVGGARAMTLVVRDTVADGKCANVWVYRYTTGYIAQLQICGNGTEKQLQIPATVGQLLIHVFRTPVGSTDSDRSLLMLMPDSSVDTAVRSTGTGVFLNYVSATAYNYKLVRPGVLASGGANDIGDDISFSGQLTHSGPVGSCAKVEATLLDPPTLAQTCAAGAVVNYFDLVSSTSQISACGRAPGSALYRCLYMFQA